MSNLPEHPVLDLSAEARNAGPITSHTPKEPTMSNLRTSGISPKAVLAFLFPALAAVAASAADWIISGKFEVTTIRTALAGLIGSGLAFLGAYLGRPGNVVVDPAPPVVNQP